MCNSRSDFHSLPIYLTPISSHFIEVCSFDNADIAVLRASGAFYDRAVIHLFDRSLRSDVSSEEWICFSAYPFSLSLHYPFPEFIMQFFRTTGLSFAQTIPMVWRVLIVLNQIKALHVPDLCIEDILIAYSLRSHGNNRFLLFSTSSNPLILKVTRNEDGWQRKFFFVRRDSITEGDSPVKWLTSANFKELAPPTEESEGRIKTVYQLPESDRTFSLRLQSSSQYSSSDMSAKIPEVFVLEELDSYFGPVQVKKEPSKPSIASKPVTSSKAIAVPKPSPVTKPHASSSRKRKETDSPASSETFHYENHGFLESRGFMTSFLNQGLEHLTSLYEESCWLNKMLEVKLKKVETTIAD
ncbi:hypothetical protein Hanom_Chr04g00328891 [Helianthus anomalus]